MSTKFRIGDRVRRLTKPQGNMAIGDEGIIIRIEDDELSFKNFHPSTDCCFKEHHFELVTNTKQEKVMKKVKDNEWNFSVSSDKLIDVLEVGQVLTREHPLAIIHRGDGYCTIAIHASIYRKALYVKPKFREALDEALNIMQDDDYFKVCSANLNPITKAVKAIRNARVLKKYRKNCEVTVVLCDV